MLTRVGLTTQTVWSTCQFTMRVTTRDRLSRHDKAACFHGLFDGDDGGQFFAEDFGLGSHLTRIEHVTCNNHGDRLPQVIHFTLSQKGIVVNNRTTIVFTWNVMSSEHRHDAML